MNIYEQYPDANKEYKFGSPKKIRIVPSESVTLYFETASGDKAYRAVAPRTFIVDDEGVWDRIRQLQKERDRLSRQVAGLRGYLNRLKKRGKK